MIAETTRSAGVHPWIPDQGDGTFCNPILWADYSDPDVIRHGDDFYLTASSFTCAPGLPILHSRDLVNWTLVNHALSRLPDARYNQVWHGGGVWAPSLRFHDGRFWIFFSTPDEGIYVTTAVDPRGVWAEPRLLQAGRGLIDPCPLWDDDGRAYLVHAFAYSRAGIRDRLRICPMEPDVSRLLGEGRIVFHAPERHPIIEGPKLFKRDGWYYILAPAGGVATGWQVALRSRDIFGPYEDRIVLEQGGSAVNGPHQGALIDLPGGRSWFIHFQDTGPYGRIVHLQPVRWRGGWPLMGRDADGNGVGEPVSAAPKPDLPAQPVAVPATSDEFDTPSLARPWQWQANPAAGWHSLTARPGCLRLHAQPVADENLYHAPHLLLQKFPARAFTVTARIDPRHLEPGDTAGLIVFGEDYAWVGLRCDEVPVFAGQAVRAACAQPIVSDAIVTSRPKGAAWLRVTVGEGARCVFSCSTDGRRFTPVGELFEARAGRWVGAKVGLFCARPEDHGGGFADFDWFRFSPPVAGHPLSLSVP